MARFARPLLGIAALALSVLSARGQFTEYPHTVAPGKWLVETDVATVAFDRYTPARDGIETRSLYLGYIQFSTGVTATTDVQFGFETWHEERVRGGGADERLRGTGELYLRAKWKFWENSEGAALALLPYYRLRDTAGSEVRPARDQWGLIVPVCCTLSEKWSFSAMLQNDWLDNGAGGRDWWVTGTAAWYYSGAGKLSWYAETCTWSQQAHGRWASLAGLGLVWQATERLSWDIALHVGLNRAAPDWYPVLRFSWTL